MMQPSKFLVVSDRHGLLPFARRLISEQQEVDVIVRKERYERAWGGLIPKRPGPKARDLSTWGEIGEEIMTGEWAVLTDSQTTRETLSGAPWLFAQLPRPEGEQRPAGLILGAWFDGEQWLQPHWVVADWGVWSNGQGPAMAGAGTLIVPPEPEALPLELLDPHTDELKSVGFKGLVAVGLDWDNVGKGWVPVSFEAGWPWLHSHLLLWEQESIAMLLSGTPIGGLTKRFVVGVPVSVPPWPHTLANTKTPGRKIEGASGEVRSQVWFHDFEVRVVNGERELWTAGLDGLVAVAMGSGNSFGLAKATALGAAGALQMAERQVRLDVGARVEGVLAWLEGRGLY